MWSKSESSEVFLVSKISEQRKQEHAETSQIFDLSNFNPQKQKQQTDSIASLDELWPHLSLVEPLPGQCILVFAEGVLESPLEALRKELDLVLDELQKAVQLLEGLLVRDPVRYCVPTVIRSLLSLYQFLTGDFQARRKQLEEICLAFVPEDFDMSVFQVEF